MYAIIAFFIVLSVLILIHEAGHYLAARLFGVKADEFGYGLPPRIIGFVKDDGKWKIVKGKDRKTYKHTIWSLNWLPIGGFVKIKGEQGDSENDPDSFHVKPVWQRFIIIAAGVFMNWVLAVILLSIGLMAGIPSMLSDIPAGATIRNQAVTIIDALPGGVAATAGIEPLDTIVRINGITPRTVEEVQSAITGAGTNEIELVIDRGRGEQLFRLTPKHMDEIGKTGVGVSLITTGSVSYPPHLAVWNGMVLTGSYTKAVIYTFVDLFKDIFNGGGDTVKNISGPVGIAVLTGRIAERGVLQLIQFSAVLSINLAVLNFLPIPALDGGRGIFLIVEAIRRKPVNRNIEALIHNIAFLILIGLIVLVTIRDIGKFF